MPETIDGKTLTANTVTEAKLSSVFANKVSNAYAQANAAYAQANTPLSGANLSGNLIISSTGRLGLNVSPNTMLHVNGTSTLGEVIEKINVSPAGMSSTLNFDVLTQPILYYTGASTSNCAINFRGNSTVTMDTFLKTGQAVTMTMIATHVSAGYVVTSVTVDSIVQSVKWAGSAAPVTATPFTTDLYTFTVIKTGSGAFTVLGSVQRYG